jgi:hypothetical protein
MGIQKKIILAGIIFILLLSSSFQAASSYIKKNKDDEYQFFPYNSLMSNTDYIEKTMVVNLSFNDLTIDRYDTDIVIRVDECNFNVMKPNYPVLPTYISMFELPFGSTFKSITFTHSKVNVHQIPGTLSFSHVPFIDSIHSNNRRLDINSKGLDDVYPSNWITFHMGGGIVEQHHTSYLVLRTYPARYDPSTNEILFINQINITLHYKEPTQPLIPKNDVYDLLIISPSEFLSDLQPLVDHKNSFGMKTNLVNLEEIYDQMFWYGRDDAEKIKYFIKSSIEEWGISHVLLVGGLNKQTDQWLVPVRYSHVVPPEEQEYAEQSFLSDLYFADIYDNEGSFSSWDSNEDNRFAVWNESYKEKMDLYPDVYLGRLPCRNRNELVIMVNKIINYEKESSDSSWFQNFLIVAGDSYPDENGFNEGELIGEAAVHVMPTFTPLRVYASMGDINRQTVNNEFNNGAGFAYFCGHGSPASWSTHFPPDGQVWTTGYNLQDMISLHNNEKLPIVVVGGCHNGQFDVSLGNIIKGIQEYGVRGYFFEEPFRFYYNEWVPNSWAWWLTSKSNGGAIATIANTGLGTHGDGDADHNNIADYLEVLNGWMELRFYELYGIEGQDDLGENHAQTMSEYLHWFLGSNEKMDTKMVQQWELFGDPSLKIAGYN